MILYGAHTNGSDLDPQEASAIVALQRPAEVAFRTLVRRAEYLRELADLIAKAPLDSATDPYDYLSNQLIDSLPPRTMAALVACASIPGASLADINNATKIPIAVGLLSECPPLSPVLRLGGAKHLRRSRCACARDRTTLPRTTPQYVGQMWSRLSRESATTREPHNCFGWRDSTRRPHPSSKRTCLLQNPQMLIRWPDEGNKYTYHGRAAEAIRTHGSPTAHHDSSASRRAHP